MFKKLPKVFYNPVSIAGGSVASVSFGLIVFLTIIDLLSTSQKPYMGIIAFVVLPVFLILGIIAFFYGAIRERRRLRKGLSKEFEFPVIDLNDPVQRRTIFFFSSAGLLLLLFSAFGSFKAYEYTDSDQFCGELCHSVMEPEYTAYQNSPHARVGCVQCHIGSGATWFVRSKLSGSYQVYATLFNKYPRPIPTPIENLRPAQETCEQCHWPKHFLGEKRREFIYFLSDEKNTKWSLDLLMKIGGGNVDFGPTSGIHWHMNIANRVYYYPIDEKRQVIPYIVVKDSEGKIKVYKSTEVKFDEKQIDTTKMRLMDCIDCHNRPTHIYHNSSYSVNLSMSIGTINSKLPYIKSIAVDALDKEYSSKSVALDSIKQIVEDFYESNYPDLAKSMKSSIDQAIVELQKIYSRNYFPTMKVSWKEFPNNIGHLYTNGCFRCHDGKHVTPEGKVLTKDCNTCHTILEQKFETGLKRESLGGLNYIHPVDIGDDWQKVNCVECHGPEKNREQKIH